MRIKHWAVATVVILGGGAALLSLSSRAATTIPYQDSARVADGEAVYAQNCAGCHGANLEGQANWQRRNEQGLLPAPPHDETGHTWHHADELLFRLTKLGPATIAGNSYRSAMPGFGGVLSDEQIWSVLAYIKAQWPADIQARHTQAFQ